MSPGVLRAVLWILYIVLNKQGQLSKSLKSYSPSTRNIFLVFLDLKRLSSVFVLLSVQVSNLLSLLVSILFFLIHGTSFHLFRFFFFHVFHLLRSVCKHFIISDAIGFGILSWISFFGSLLVYRNVTDFCMLVSWHASLSNLFISSNSIFVDLILCIKSCPMQTESFTVSFLIWICFIICYLYKLLFLFLPLSKTYRTMLNRRV